MVVGGAMLLVLFYVAHGLLAHYVDRTLTRQVTVEFGVVGALATLVVFASAFLG
jgi:intracellular septation protein A